MTYWTTSEPIKEGETVFMTGPSWIKRRWWELWKPRWTKGPVETKRYTVGKIIAVQPWPRDSGRLPKGENAEGG